MNRFFTNNKEELSAFNAILSSAKNIIVTSHQNPDGDAFGSGLGFTLFLKNAFPDTVVTFVSPTDYAPFLAWLPGVSDLKVYNSNLDNIIQDSDLIFCLDFSAISRLKDMAEVVLNSKAKKVIVDHHELPENFADFYYWDQEASSTCELIWNLMGELKMPTAINTEIATCIYTGLLTDTGSFRFPATSPQVHLIAAKLLQLGVKPNEIHRSLFDKNPVERLQLLAHILNNNMNYLPELRTVYFTAFEEELKKFSSNNGDTEGIVNYGLSIKGVVMAAIFIEKDGIIKISFRSIHGFSVADLARDHFEGGGHKNAAGGRSSLTMQKTIEKFLTLLPNYQKELLEQPN